MVTPIRPKKRKPVKLKPCLKNGQPQSGWLFCFIARPARKNSKRQVAEYHSISGEVRGFLGPRCTPAYKRKDAVSFPSKDATVYAIQACQLYLNKRGVDDPEIIYKRAEKRG